MKFLYSALVICLLAPGVSAQGVRMSADFLPLEVGNRWVYDIVNESGQKIGDTDFSVQQYTIIGGRSYYALTRFPFAAPDGPPVKLIRYDRQERQYVTMSDSEESPLFLADGAKANVLQSDPSGLPLKFVLTLDLMELTFQRGVGIVEAHIQGGNGVQIAKLAAMRAGDLTKAQQPAVQSGPVVPETKPPEPKPKMGVDNVAKITEDNPVLDVQAVAVSGGHKFVLNVLNTSDKLLPFSFTSGQTYDFLVLDADSGQQVWRWSQRMFFTQVVRREAIRPNKSWSFEVTWNHLDGNLNPVEPGKYKVVGVVATQPQIESEPAAFEIK